MVSLFAIPIIPRITTKMDKISRTIPITATVTRAGVIIVGEGVDAIARHISIGKIKKVKKQRISDNIKEVIPI
ncbi:MAG: hypothetical protein ACFFAN_06480 [Promethearchaeota archaeon]